jgi:hypothetical protein
MHALVEFEEADAAARARTALSNRDLNGGQLRCVVHSLVHIPLRILPSERPIPSASLTLYCYALSDLRFRLWAISISLVWLSCRLVISHTYARTAGSSLSTPGSARCTCVWTRSVRATTLAAHRRRRWRRRPRRPRRRSRRPRSRRGSSPSPTVASCTSGTWRGGSGVRSSSSTSSTSACISHLHCALCLVP